MAKRKGIARSLVCDVEVPVLRYMIDNKENEIIHDETFIKHWENGLQRKSFDRNLKKKLRKELKGFRKELKKDKTDLAKLRSKLRKCM